MTIQPFEIKPYKSLGSVAFGMATEEARKSMGNEKYTPFQKSQDEYSPVDAYDDLGVYIYYDKNDRVESFEVMDNCKITYDGEMLMGKNIAKFVLWLESNGHKVSESEGFYRVDEFGFGFSGSGDDSVSEKMTKIGYILVYHERYWD